MEPRDAQEGVHPIIEERLPVFLFTLQKAAAGHRGVRPEPAGVRVSLPRQGAADDTSTYLREGGDIL